VRRVRRDVDDGAAAGFQVRQRLLSEHQRSHQVGSQLLSGDVPVDRAKRRRAGDSSIVDQDIDAPEGIECGRHHPARPVGRRDVGDNGPDPGVTLSGLLEGDAGSPDDNHLGSFSGELAGGLTTDPRTATGDDHDSPAQCWRSHTCHVRIISSAQSSPASMLHIPETRR
jgi:hypothetical protein